MLKLFGLKFIVFGMAWVMMFNVQAETADLNSLERPISESSNGEKLVVPAVNSSESQPNSGVEVKTKEEGEPVQGKEITEAPIKAEVESTPQPESNSFIPKPPSTTNVETKVEETKPKESISKETIPEEKNQKETLSKEAVNESDSSVEGQLEEGSGVSTALSPLFEAESMRVCSMGHRNHKVEKFEYIKKQEINGLKKRVKYSARQNPRFECQIALENKERDLVYLSCWKGTFDKVNLSRFQLSYFYKSDYLFVNKKNGKMVLLKVNSPEGSCSSDFRPVVKKKVKILKTQETGPGLADLTF